MRNKAASASKAEKDNLKEEFIDVEVFPGALRCACCGYNMPSYTAPDRSVIVECHTPTCDQRNKRLCLPRTLVSCKVIQ